MDILHISEAMGGGVTTAIIQYVRSAPQHRHYLLATTRESAKVKDAILEEYFDGIFELPRKTLQAIAKIRFVYKQINPHKVHLHSSFAGFFGRVSGLPRSKVIYTPHCYAFERKDIALPARLAIYAAEQLLSLGGSEIAGVSPREAALGSKMLGIRRSQFLPNSASFDPRPERDPRRSQIVIATVGRLCPQKDPSYFARVARTALARSNSLKFIWLGGGEARYQRQLVDSGVEVTGWLERYKIEQHLKTADAYLHTASWEGNPMSIIEAATVGLPIYARRLDALESLGMTHLGTNENTLSDQLLHASKTGDWQIGKENCRIVVSLASSENQASSLRKIYGA